MTDTLLRRPDRPHPYAAGAGPRRIPVARSEGRAKGGAQLRSRGDPQFGEDPVEVGADGPVREVQPLADLLVGQPLGGHLDDLELLRRELVPGLAVPAAAGLPGGPQLLARPLAPGNDPEG